MATDLKNLKRLETLLTAFDSEVVQPEELIQAMEAMTQVITQSGELLSKKINETGEAKTGEIKQLESKLDSVSNQLANLIDEVRNDSSLDAGDIRQLVASEIKRIEQAIPVLPDEFDASDIQTSLLEHKALLDGLSILVVGENVRNALESLPTGDKLTIDAIEGLTEALAKRQAQVQNATAIIAHRLDQIGNVAIVGATNGQALIYQAATDTWVPGSVSGGAVEGTAILSTGETVGKVLQADGDGTSSFVALAGGGNAQTANPLSQFAATTLAQLNGVISDATLGDASDFATSAQGTLAASASQPGHTHVAANITDFASAVAATASVTANTAKVTNATHSGEVTGSTTLTVDKTAITGKTTVTAVGTDYVLISDTSDSGNLKKALVSDFAGGSGNNYFNNEFIDQSGGTSDTYGVLAGLVNSSNTLYTVSQSVYQTGKLEIYLNGQLQTQGSGEDWTETTPASGTFTFATAPATGDLITVKYQTQALSSDTVLTNSTFNAKGDILSASADNTLSILGVGTNGQVLTADSAETSGLKWATAAGGGDMVLASVQSVTGLKTFDTTKIAIKGSSTGTTAIASANASGTSYTATLPAATGTIALTSDITGTNSGTNTGDNATNTQYSSLVTNATHTGDVTGSGALTIATGAVTLAKMADMATASVIYRKTAGTGVPEVQTLATLKTDLGLTGTNSGDQDLSSYAPKASPTFTGTVSGVTATHVGLGNVDNTSNATERAATATLTNKRINARVDSSASGNITPNKANYDEHYRTAQSAAITISNNTSPAVGDIAVIYLTDNATARGITFDTHHKALTGLALPTTTTISKSMEIIIKYVTTTKALVSFIEEA